MHLKRLEAFGFKSFADRTVFEFEHGVTGIVGPNGCGKSNVVDAIKWALGEQRPTSIRGSEMADVLFAGSGSRKPLGLSEVSLVFDNADGFLPTETDEVILTRRLYRDGTSEYLLNKQLTRLKDIRELMMDTGGGRGALSILEQGKIDAVLQENPVERRHVFEEAAGVSRYRQRQRETTRKIEQLDDNLARLRDVIKVGEKQLRSIRAQAGRAERFRTLEKELRARRIELGLHRYERLLSERSEATARVEDLASQEAEANSRLAEASTDLSGKERAVDELRGRAATLEAEAGKAEGAAEAALERASSADALAGELEGRIQWYEGEIEVTLRRLEEAQEQTDLSQKDEDAADSDVETQDDALAAAEAAIQAALESLRATEEQVASLRAEALELLDRKGRLANARARATAEEESLRARGVRIAARREEVATVLHNAETGEAGAREEATAAGQQRDGAAHELREAEEAVARGEAKLEDLRGRQASLDRAVSAARSRLDVLTSLRDRH
ncbi:MAG: AAA family ATPase, partial [Planctomycetota bacterium]